MTILLKTIYWFNAIKIQNTISFWTETEKGKKKNYPKNHMEPQRISDSQKYWAKNMVLERLPFQSHSNKTQTDTQTNAAQLKTQIWVHKLQQFSVW